MREALGGGKYVYFFQYNKILGGGGETGALGGNYSPPNRANRRPCMEFQERS